MRTMTEASDHNGPDLDYLYVYAETSYLVPQL